MKNLDFVPFAPSSATASSSASSSVAAASNAAGELSQGAVARFGLKRRRSTSNTNLFASRTTTLSRQNSSHELGTFALPDDEDGDEFYKLLIEETLPAAAFKVNPMNEIAAQANARDKDKGYIQNLYLPRPPLDWNIKSRVRISSELDFAWSHVIPVKSECQGIRSFLVSTPQTSSQRFGRMAEDRSNQNYTAGDDDDKNNDKNKGKSGNRGMGPRHQALQAEAALFQEAMLYWTFPHESYPSAHPFMEAYRFADTKPKEVRNLEEKRNLQLMQERWLQWEAAFRSLYHFLRCGKTPAFYYNDGEAFAILWLAALPTSEEENGEMGTCSSSSSASSSSLVPVPVPRNEPVAIISASSHSFRMQLRTAGVFFSMPHRDSLKRTDSSLHAPNGSGGPLSSSSSSRPARPDDDISDSDSDADEVHRHTRRLDREHEKKLKLEKADDRLFSSMLLVQGYQAVHALYDYLINDERRKKDTEDVPILYSATAFINGTLKSLQVSKMGQGSGGKKQLGSSSSSLSSASASSSSSSSSAFSNSTMLSSSSTAFSSSTSLPRSTSSSSLPVASAGLRPSGPYVLEITGPVLPFAMLKLGHVLQVTQHGNFECKITGDILTRHFNSLDMVPHLSYTDLGAPSSPVCAVAPHAAATERNIFLRGGGGGGGMESTGAATYAYSAMRPYVTSIKKIKCVQQQQEQQQQPDVEDEPPTAGATTTVPAVAAATAAVTTCKYMIAI